MKPTRFASAFFAAGLLAALLVAPVAAGAPGSGAQTLAERSRAAKKIKEQSTRKVWTNEDLRQLEGGWGVNVVGTSLKKPEEAAAPAGPVAAPAQPAPATSFYADMPMEEREQWIAVLEREIADSETELIELRSRALSAPTEAERATASQQITGVQQKLDANRAEIEGIRNTPPPKPKKAAPAAKPAPSSS